MDLSERKGAPLIRHPWESARAVAIEAIVRELGIEGARVLDVGCGDGYLVSALQRSLHFREVVAQDLHLSDELIAELERTRAQIRFVRSLDGLEFRADLVLLLDVLEHIEDAERWLTELVRTRLAQGGRMLITVPAFQALFTEHDRTLKHYRRYSRAALVASVRRCGLEVLDSGYLFASLLVPRGISALREMLFPPRAGALSPGVGQWQASGRLTALLHQALAFDNQLCRSAHERGVTLPGLTVWLTARAAQ